METTRIDRWLWAVRLFRTRAAAADACRGGHVTINDAKAKPATPVRVGDTVRARAAGRQRIAEVVRVIDTRVSAAAAADCLIDRTPPPPPRELAGPSLIRDRGAGRPSKRERRQIDRARRRGR